MKFEKFIIKLFLVYKATIYLVKGQNISEEKSDCAKLYSYVNEDSTNNPDDFCYNYGIYRDQEGYIKSLSSS